MKNITHKTTFKFNKKTGQHITDDELVSIYQCSDKSWRISYYPFADKDRNLTKGKAFELAQERHKESLNLINSISI